MVNTNIQGAIPIEGKGLTYKASGNYGNGEYSIFKNVELIDGAIRTRRPIQPNYGYEGSSIYVESGDKVEYVSRFMGETNNGQAFAAGWGQSYLFGGQLREALKSFNGSVLPQPADDQDYTNNAVFTPSFGHFVVGIFEYNRRVYWITQKTSNSPDTNELWLFYSNEDETVDDYTTFAPPNSVKILDFSASKLDVSDYIVRKIFVHKERIFIVTPVGVYFSKATDPTVFAIPDGGFVGVENATIHDAVALGDSIYIATSRKLYLYTYSVDPNEDGFMRSIFEGREITALCVNSSNIYAADSRTLYNVSGSNVEVLVDLTSVFKTINSKLDVAKLVSFGDSIFILRKDITTSRELVSPARISSGDSHVSLYNTLTGNISTVEFNDSLSVPDVNNGLRGTSPGKIIDIAVPASPYQHAAYFIVAHRPVDLTNWQKGIYQRFYFMNESRNETRSLDSNPADQAELDATYPYSNSGIDVVSDTADVLSKHRIKIDVQLENWTPDGTEYLMKKFRGLFISGQLPDDLVTRMTVYYDDVNSASFTDLPLSQLHTIGKNRATPFPYRVRVNQRSKTLSLRFYTGDEALMGASDPDAVIDPTLSPYFFTLTDLRVLWSYVSHVGNLTN